MFKELKQIMGLREDDELIGVIVVLLAFLLMGFWLRGCREDATVLELPEQVAETDSNYVTNPTLDTPIAPLGFRGGDVVLTGDGEPNSELDIYIDEAFVGTTTVDNFGRWEQSAVITGIGQHLVELRTNRANDITPYTTSYPVSIADTATEVIVSPTRTVAPQATEESNQAALPVAPLPNPTVEIADEIAEVIDPTATSLPTATTAPTNASVPATDVPEPTETTAPTETAVPPTQTPIPLMTNTPTVTPVPTDPPLSSIPTFTLGSIETVGFSGNADTGLTNANVSMRGTGNAGDSVDILLDGELVGLTAVLDDGTWVFEDTLSLAAGDYTLSAHPQKAIDQSVFGSISVPQSIVNFRVNYAGSVGSDVQPDPIDITTAPAVSIILDASWTMEDPFNESTTRINVARKALVRAVEQTIPSNVGVAYRAFGHLEGNFSCRTDLVTPLQQINRGQLAAAIWATQPQLNAATPLAESLRLAAEDLAGTSGPKTIILITDGKETCNGDPTAVVQDLIAQGFDISINIIGLQLDEELGNNFAQLAQLGNGSYYNVNQEGDLATAFNDISGSAYRVLNSAGDVVGQGIIGGQTIPLPVGRYTVEVLTNPAQTLTEIEVTQDVTVTLP